MVATDEQIGVKIEVEERSVVIDFGGKMDHFLTTWQDAQELSVLELAASDVPIKPIVFDPWVITREQGQVRIGTHQDKYVCLFFEWNDRLEFGPEAAVVVAWAIQKKAQDLWLLEEKNVRILYYADGRMQPPYCMASPKTVFAPGDNPKVLVPRKRRRF